MPLILGVARLVPFQPWLLELGLVERPDLSGTVEGLWIEPGQLLELINAWTLAQYALAVSYWLCPRLRPSVGPGRPYTYPDAVVLLTVIVMRVWRKGYESFTGWLARNSCLAEHLGIRPAARMDSWRPSVQPNCPAEPATWACCPSWSSLSVWYGS
jgi:hypothetical protein